MRGFHRGLKILRRTGAINIFISFIVASCIIALILSLIEPQIESFGDGIWYCFVSATTIGFGDICVTTAFGRILTIFIAIYGIFVVAMVPGVVVSYYLEYLKIQEKETVSIFMEKLERLPDLSKDELKELSERIKKIR